MLFMTHVPMHDCPHDEDVNSNVKLTKYTFFYKEPLYKEPTRRRSKHLKNLAIFYGRRIKSLKNFSILYILSNRCLYA